MTKYQNFLTAEHRSELNALLISSTLKERERRRVVFLQHIDAGKTYDEIRTIYSISEASLVALVKKYLSGGLSCLYDAPRSGRPTIHSTVEQDKITLLSCDTPPKGHSQWSLRLLADKVVELGYCEQMSHTQVHKILKKKV